MNFLLHTAWTFVFLLPSMSVFVTSQFIRVCKSPFTSLPWTQIYSFSSVCTLNVPLHEIFCTSLSSHLLAQQTNAFVLSLFNDGVGLSPGSAMTVSPGWYDCHWNTSKRALVSRETPSNVQQTDAVAHLITSLKQLSSHSQSNLVSSRVLRPTLRPTPNMETAWEAI